MFGIAMLSMLLLMASCGKKTDSTNKLTGSAITTFDDCKNAQQPVTISYPAKCNIDGKVFVQRIKTDADKVLHSKKGDLVLGYKDGKAILTGTLQRPTPCVDWKIRLNEYSDKSKLEMGIYDANKETTCIQSAGEPQEIGISASSKQDTHYTIMLEEDTVFDGKI